MKHLLPSVSSFLLGRLGFGNPWESFTYSGPRPLPGVFNVSQIFLPRVSQTCGDAALALLPAETFVPEALGVCRAHPSLAWYFLVVFRVYFHSLCISTFSCHLGYNFRRFFFPPYFIQSITTRALCPEESSGYLICHIARYGSLRLLLDFCVPTVRIFQKQCGEPQGSGPHRPWIDKGCLLAK